MWKLGIIFLTLFYLCLGEPSSSIYYCSDMNPQLHVDIEQLMGIWYGIEIISHKSDAKHEILYEEGCPVLYFSEVIKPSTITPIYGNPYQQHNYGINSYGRRYKDNTYGGTYEEQIVYSTQSTYDEDYEYYQRLNNYQRPIYGGASDFNKRRYNEDIKRLRLMWDDRGSFTEYTMRYNVSKAGFWISSGPQNGSALEPKFNYFAGTIQVLKAVGNHMVLVFCHQLPDKQLYSVLLSRVQNLSQSEIHGVHNLLNRKGLSTASIRKVCTHNSTQKLAMNVLGVIITTIILSFM